MTYPQAPAAEAEHWTLQVTPPGAVSLDTLALIGACVLTVMLAGGSCVKEIAGLPVIVTFAAAGFDIDTGDAAAITTLPDGAEAGAV